METLISAQQAGGIVRRVREDRGMSRSEVARLSGVGQRTLYALETGEAENLGLGKFLKILETLGLSASIGLEASDADSPDAPAPFETPWYEMADMWKLEESDAQ